ncbi:OPT-domain-containing protein [Aureobasidium sp. EXF-12298]|nr:OPT-domain-containing protein [Aureobasidium sp. EXF-12298]
MSDPEKRVGQVEIEPIAKDVVFGQVVELKNESGDNLPNKEFQDDLNVTTDDYIHAREEAQSFTLEQTRDMMAKVYKIHELDPNFPDSILDKIREFLFNEDVFINPEKHAELIAEVKIEAALIVNNSPYAEVRAVVDNTDDPNMPCASLRAYVIGLIFVSLLAFINQLFSIRQPSITVEANVAQLLAYPVGVAAARWLPDKGFTLFGTRHSLNPGPFSKKEHMLITIMAKVGANLPYTDYVVWVQFLPHMFNQSWAGSFAYQLVIAMGTNFIGFGLAGICRRFLVYPAYCVWPTSLVTMALNNSFHDPSNPSVMGPFKKVFTMSRLKFFVLTFTAMFFYFWFPNFIFGALSTFNWINWIAPNNLNLSTVTGMNNGLGFNPFPTFDWNILLWDQMDPLMVPFFNTINRFAGLVISAFAVLGVWYSNTFNTGYLPINSNKVFDHYGKFYNVTRTLDHRGMFDAAKYTAYSPAYLSAANLTVYACFFAIYTATISYAFMYHRHEIMMGFKNLFHRGEREEYNDVHNRLMAVYPEVPEWWYLICLCISVAFGCAGIAAWPTYTTVGTVFYGLALCLVFIIPIGIIRAITGIQVTLNVLAEFIGGAWVGGNALAMNFFKSFGYVTCAHTIQFLNDLKLAHYTKIPPRHAFWAQMVACFVSTVVCTGVLNFQIHIKDVCTTNAPNRFYCPGNNTFFTASVLWGTLGPHKVFGKGGLYTLLLIGFPVGLVVPPILYYVTRAFPQKKWLRQIHPIAIIYGALTWAPYNMAYVWPQVPIGFIAMVWLKTRYLACWSKYNYVLSASWSAAIGISAIIIFFSVQYSGNVSLDWWGNNVSSMGCEGTACTRLKLAKGEFFGPRSW